MLESGVRTLHEQGFANSGIREITAAAGVPQGSFTNHFKSKEAFGLAVLDRYYKGIQAIMAATLGDHSLSPVDRLHAYFDTVTTGFADSDWHHGCLIGNLSLETAEHSDALRARLVLMLGDITGVFVQAIHAAQSAGEIRDDFAAEEVASALMASWQGAILWMKVHRCAKSIQRFKRVTLAAFLAVPVQSAAKPSSDG